MPRDTFSSGSDESILIRAWGIVRRRWVVATLAFATVLAAVASLVLNLPDLYRASASVIVERPLADLSRSGVGGDLERRLHVIKQEVLSRDRLTALVKRYDLYPDLRGKMSFEDILNQARNDIEMVPNGPERAAGATSTVTFDLTYTGASPTVVADVTNDIAKFYVSYNDQMRADAATSTADLRKAELDAARRRVQDLQGQFNTFALSHQQQLPQAVSMNTAAFNRLTEELRRTSDAIWRAQIDRERMLDALEAATGAAREVVAGTAAVSGDDGEVPPSKELTAIAGELEDARTELRKAQAEGLGAGHNVVVTLNERIASLERDRDAQRRKDLAAHQAEKAASEKAQAAATGADAPRALPRTSRRSVQDIDDEIARLRKEETRIQSALDNLELRFEGAPKVQQDYILLSRDLDTAKSTFQELQRSYDEARSVQTVETGRQGERFRILDAAIPPEGPAAPNRLRLLIMGLLFALCAAGVAVLGAEKLDTSFHSVDELREYTSVPVIGTIPQIGSGPRRGYVRLVLGTVSAVAVVALVATLSAYFATGNEQLVRMLQRAG